MNPEERIAKLESNVRTLGIWLIVVGVFAFFAFFFGVKTYSQEIVRPEKVPTPHDAVGWQVADLALLPIEDQPSQLYLWIPPWGNRDWIHATDFAVNTAVSHSQVIQKGAVLANGWMMRFDLRRLVPNLIQRAKTITVIDGLAVDDPNFHVPASNLKLKNVAILAPHLQQDAAILAANLTLSPGRIYRADWFIYKALSTLEGGRYYDFIQIDRKPKSGQTAQSVWLASLGIFEAETQKLAGDQRSAIFRSGVTGKPRRIDVLYGLGRGGALASITHDIADEDTAAGQHPLRNLLAFEDRAREIIVQRPNGMHAFALFDNRGALQDSVPDNIARDSTIPSPHTGRLQPAIGCIRCHGAPSHDGWKPFGNDVQTVLKSGLDVFSDLADEKRTREEIIDTLASQYAGDLDGPDSPLGRGRRDYLAAVFRITGGPRVGEVKAGELPQSPVTKVSETIGQIYSSYRYDLITPERAALEIGHKNSPIAEALGPVVPGVTVDPIEGTLRAGIAVNRSDFEPIYADLMLKARKVSP